MDVMRCAFDVFFVRGTREGGINRKSDIYDVNREDKITCFHSNLSRIARV